MTRVKSCLERQADMAGQRGPSSSLIERGRSVGRSKACSGCSLRRASWPKPEPACFGPRRFEDDDVECDYECYPIGAEVACETCELNEDFSEYYGRAIWMCAG
jgi:hypothetical protein